MSENDVLLHHENEGLDPTVAVPMPATFGNSYPLEQETVPAYFCHVCIALRTGRRFQKPLADHPEKRAVAFSDCLCGDVCRLPCRPHLEQQLSVRIQGFAAEVPFAVVSALSFCV